MVEKPLSSTERYSYIFVSLLLCLIAVVVLIIARNFPATSISTDIGAGAFPTIYAWLLILLSLILMGHYLSGGRPQQDPEAQTGATFTFVRWSGPLSTVIACIIYIWVMEYIGYLMATIIFMSFIMKVAGIQRWQINVTLAVMLSTTLYFLFSLALNVPLPESSLLESLISE